MGSEMCIRDRYVHRLNDGKMSLEIREVHQFIVIDTVPLETAITYSSTIVFYYCFSRKSLKTPTKRISVHVMSANNGTFEL